MYRYNILRNMLLEGLLTISAFTGYGQTLQQDISNKKNENNAIDQAITTELHYQNRKKIAQVLNTLLSDEHILYIKARNYH